MFEKTIPLNEFVTFQRGYDLPKGDRKNGNIPVVASTGVGGYHNKAKVEAPGVVIGRSGSIGGGQFITKNFWPLNTTLWVKDFKGHHPRYIYYLLKSIDFKKLNVGSGVPTLNRNHLSTILVSDIGINYEKKIAEILGIIDDKITVNQQINQSLEAMAQAIFKSWFVDFEPVKAKIAAIEADEDVESVTHAAMRAISGKNDNELDKMQVEQPKEHGQLKIMAELFPAAMQDSELGEVPEGWEVSIIGDEVNVVGGGTPSTKIPDFWEGGEIHWTTPKDLSNLTDKVLLTTDRKITESGLKKVSSGLLPVNTVLMSSRAPVGYLALAKVPVAVNQGYIAMVCDRRLSPEFVIQWCNSVMNDIKQRSSGTTFAEISKKNFKIIPVLVPTKEIQQSYSELVSGLYDKITKIVIECNTLIDIRDSLLPKLLSGEVTIQGCVFE